MDISTPDSVSISVLVRILENKVLVTRTYQEQSGSPVLGFVRTRELNLLLKASGVLEENFSASKVQKNSQS